MDFRQMTAPCGLPCFACYLYQANENVELRSTVSKILGIPPEKAVCAGCRNEQGRCAHHDQTCRLYPCAGRKGVAFCSECEDFPCDILHPYADRPELWHNTKVFNLLMIKKLGLETWAQTKASAILDTYSHGKWKL
jgi:hypothetical protein